MTEDRQKEKQYGYRSLQELNLLDDFLFQQMLLREETAEEFCRILLGTILGRHIRRVRVVPQKEIPGADTGLHGIRMDAYIYTVEEEAVLVEEPFLDADIVPAVYDVEPDRHTGKRELPLRMRYYHGMMDTRLLASGAPYLSLPQTVIIAILPYDPFGQKRMVYTVQNRCVEDPSIPYDDRAKKIFLYTRGTKDVPSQKLRDMLKYMEETTDENVTNPELDAIRRQVEAVKRNREVNISYMRAVDWEYMIRREGREEGFEEGIGQSVRIFIESCRELGVAREQVEEKLLKKYRMSAPDIQERMEQYW